MAIATINKKSRHDLRLQRKAGRIVADVHALVKEAIKPGVTTAELDAKAEEYIRKSGASPTFLGMYGFPATLCTSINDEVVHGIPSKERVLNEGDVISVDVGATYKGLIADAAFTHPVGQVSDDVAKLLIVTEESLFAAIAAMTAGEHLHVIGEAVETVCNEHGYGLVRNYGGHSVGHKLHEEPFIHNFKTEDPGPVMQAGNTLAVEPMLNLGTAEVYTEDDEWTVRTKDHKPSAHFEHTILITDGEAEPLTIFEAGFRHTDFLKN